MIENTLPRIPELIKKKIYKRVIICLFFVFFSFFVATIYDIYSNIPLLKEKMFSISEDVRDFIIGQVLINNEENIPPTINENGIKNKVKIEWNRFDLRKKKGTIEWMPPFSWEYSDNIISLDGKNYGSLYIYGSLLSDNIFVEQFFSKFFFSLFSILFVFFCLRPLSKRIPSDLFSNPINYIFSFIKRGCVDSDAIMISECGTREVYHLAKRFSELVLVEKAHTREQALVEFSKQIAHDIRSPVSAILAISSDLSSLPEEARISLRNAVRRIDSIANKLLYFSGNNAYLEKSSTFLLVPAILSVISEKEVLCKKSEVKLEFNIEKNLGFSFIYSNLCDFQRMLSNIINNAIEAIPDTGNIKINTFLKDNDIYISILDTGKGMSNKAVHDILSGKVITEKKSGFGMGLSSARKFLYSQEGSINIESEIGVGTKVEIKLKQGSKPSWICDKIPFFKNGVVVVLDDDDFIHSAWLEFFSEEIDKNLTKIVHFKESTRCVNYILNLSDIERRSTVCLIDYDLMEQDTSGLDVIKTLKPINTVLVTGFYEEESVIKKAILSNVKIFPKNLVNYAKKVFIDAVSMCNDTLSEIVLLDDCAEVSEMIRFLCKSKKRKIDIYNDTYEFFDKIELYNKSNVKICLDYNISDFVNGLEVAEILFLKGFYNLYLVSGSDFRQIDIPDYIKILPSKTSILNLELSS